MTIFYLQFPIFSSQTNAIMLKGNTCEMEMSRMKASATRLLNSRSRQVEQRSYPPTTQQSIVSHDICALSLADHCKPLIGREAWQLPTGKKDCFLPKLGCERLRFPCPLCRISIRRFYVRDEGENCSSFSTFYAGQSMFRSLTQRAIAFRLMKQRFLSGIKPNSLWPGRSAAHR